MEWPRRAGGVPCGAAGGACRLRQQVERHHDAEPLGERLGQFVDGGGGHELWVKFFNGTTPAATKVTLLQNGQQFAAVITAQAASPLAKSAQAKVTSVTVTSPTTATVKYSIVEGGQVAVPDQTGQAVLQGGVWKVSAPSFQALLKLEQGQTSGSPSPSPSAS